MPRLFELLECTLRNHGKNLCQYGDEFWNINSNIEYKCITFLHKVRIFFLSFSKRLSIQPCSRPGISLYWRPRVVHGCRNRKSLILCLLRKTTVHSLIECRRPYQLVRSSEFLANWLWNTARRIFANPYFPTSAFAYGLYREYTVHFRVRVCLDCVVEYT